MRFVPGRRAGIFDDLMAFVAITWFAPGWGGLWALPLLAWTAGMSFGFRHGLRDDADRLASNVLLAVLALGVVHIVVHGSLGVLSVVFALVAIAEGMNEGRSVVQDCAAKRSKAAKIALLAGGRR